MNNIINNIFCTDYVYLYMILFYVVLGILMYIRIFIWKKTSEEVKLSITGTKLYKAATMHTNEIFIGSYPLTISEVDTPAGKRYIALNAKDRRKCVRDNGKSLTVFHDKKWNILATQKMPRLTKMAILANLFGYYIFWVLLYLAAKFLTEKFIPDTSAMACIIISVVFVLVAVKYLVLDFIIFDLKLKFKYNRCTKDYKIKDEKK